MMIRHRSQGGKTTKNVTRREGEMEKRTLKTAKIKDRRNKQTKSKKKTIYICTHTHTNKKDNKHNEELRRKDKEEIDSALRIEYAHEVACDDGQLRVVSWLRKESCGAVWTG